MNTLHEAPQEMQNQQPENNSASAVRARVLLLYSTRFGDSLAVARAVAQRLAQDGIEGHLQALEQAQDMDVQPFAKAVLVASIRYGHFHKSLYAFVARNAQWLQKTGSGFMSLCLTARKPEKRTPQTNIYTRKFLARAKPLGWEPAHCAVVAGALRYPRYNLIDRLCIRFIMTITGGETDTSREYEYTDWAQVERFAAEIGATVRTAGA